MAGRAARRRARAPSLDHDDLHPWNILLAQADGAGRARFYDWGDSVVAHPFVSMLVPLGYMCQHLEVGVEAPEILRLRDAYLEPFTDLAPHAELVATLEIACRVGKVARTLTWNWSVGALGEEEAGQFATAPLQELASLLDDSYLGVTEQLQHRGRVTGKVDRPQPQRRGGQRWHILGPVDLVAVLLVEGVDDIPDGVLTGLDQPRDRRHRVNVCGQVH